jgi:hypothetical protein
MRIILAALAAALAGCAPDPEAVAPLERDRAFWKVVLPAQADYEACVDAIQEIPPWPFRRANPRRMGLPPTAERAAITDVPDDAMVAAHRRYAEKGDRCYRDFADAVLPVAPEAARARMAYLAEHRALDEAFYVERWAVGEHFRRRWALFERWRPAIELLPLAERRLLMRDHMDAERRRIMGGL